MRPKKTVKRENLIYWPYAPMENFNSSRNVSPQNVKAE